jgi:tetratricopeptide (TPR) repeat protein
VKHEAAVKELQGALESISSRQLKYYAYLFLGQEFADLDQKGEARQCFEIAARLFPSAPSPLLSMSRLSYEEGDFKSALNRIERLFEPLVQYSAYDPWWDYDRTHGFDTDALIEEMRRKLGGLSE